MHNLLPQVSSEQEWKAGQERRMKRGEDWQAAEAAARGTQSQSARSAAAHASGAWSVNRTTFALRAEKNEYFNKLETLDDVEPMRARAYEPASVWANVWLAALASQLVRCFEPCALGFIMTLARSDWEGALALKCAYQC